MTELRVILDELAANAHGGTSRYAGELTRALIATAPANTRVVGVVPASPEADYERILAKLPGLGSLEKNALARRELAAAWRRGLVLTGRSVMIHATGLLAPLISRDRVHRPGDQVVVTVHDAIAWTHPQLISPRHASWVRAMGRRAERSADAVVVPSHAVAFELSQHLTLGDRIRVVPGAPSSSLAPTDTTTERAATLGLPERYLFTVASTEPKKNLTALLEALPLMREPLPLVVVGADTDAVASLAPELPAERVVALGSIDDELLGHVYLNAHAYVQPSIAGGDGLAVTEALAFGLPVVHTDVPSLEEVTAGSAIVVPLEGDDFPHRLADALDALTDTIAERLSIASGDRARAFSWRDSAEKVWQLHADL